MRVRVSEKVMRGVRGANPFENIIGKTGSELVVLGKHVKVRVRV